MSDSPFIILFYDEDLEMIEEGDGDGKDSARSRKKRFVEISPELEESHVKRNYYQHDDMDEIETKIVTFDREDERNGEGGDHFIDEDGNGVKDIDEEAERVTLLIVNM